MHSHHRLWSWEIEHKFVNVKWWHEGKHFLFFLSSLIGLLSIQSYCVLPAIRLKTIPLSMVHPWLDTYCYCPAAQSSVPRICYAAGARSQTLFYLASRKALCKMFNHIIFIVIISYPHIFCKFTYNLLLTFMLSVVTSVYFVNVI